MDNAHCLADRSAFYNINFCCVFINLFRVQFIKPLFFLGIEISDEEAEKIFTVQQAVDLIKAKLDS